MGKNCVNYPLITNANVLKGSRMKINKCHTILFIFFLGALNSLNALFIYEVLIEKKASEETASSNDESSSLRSQSIQVRGLSFSQTLFDDGKRLSQPITFGLGTFSIGRMYLTTQEPAKTFSLTKAFLEEKTASDGRTIALQLKVTTPPFLQPPTMATKMSYNFCYIAEQKLTQQLKKATHHFILPPTMAAKRF